MERPSATMRGLIRQTTHDLGLIWSGIVGPLRRSRVMARDFSALSAYSAVSVIRRLTAKNAETAEVASRRLVPLPFPPDPEIGIYSRPSGLFRR
jgi:hypothetical protein